MTDTIAMMQRSVSDYVQSLLKSQRLGRQVVAHRTVEGPTIRSEAIQKVVSQPLQTMLSKLGIQALYRHQIEALQAIRQGEHTVVATPTGSGKSLIYNLSLFDALAADPNSRALYLFPLKALTRDQLKNFNRWVQAQPAIKGSAAVYDGDTSAYGRRKIRQSPPNAVMTNPDMLHLALLAHHTKWADFFRYLKLVVIDEVHTYRGLLGSHMAQVLRRLRRICDFYGASPLHIFTSATVANPGELAASLSGLKVATVQMSAAATGSRHQMIIDPESGPAQTAILLLKAALARKLRTIVYTQSRKLAELITMWVQQDAGRWAEWISVYRAGLLPAERRQIEKRLMDGDLLAVVSTSALELGINIGDLDVCLLVGYPGSMIATWQRGGRVGRKGQESAVVLIAGQDALDQYFVAQPKAFFNGKPESAVVNPNNPIVMKAHLVCSAAEQPFQCSESWLQEGPVAQSLNELETTGQLLRTADGKTLYAREKRPHQKVDIRSAGERYRLVSGTTVVGEINTFRRYRDAHPGAIYLHQGVTYLVGQADLAKNEISVQPVTTEYHTRVRSDSDVEILDIFEYKYIDKTYIYIGKIKLTDKVTGFDKIHTFNGRHLGHADLDVPEVVFTTDAIWYEIPPGICSLVQKKGFDLPGALHAAEHATIGIMPLVVLADRNDLGGMATPWHPQNGKASIFIYDAVPGGAGFVHQAFMNPLQLLDIASETISRCNCDRGCPACVHSPKCGSGNQPLDKQGALFLLSQIAGSRRVGHETSPSNETVFQTKSKMSIPYHPNYGVFDLETQRSAKEVGGWHRARDMKLSCGVVYDARQDRYRVYGEDGVHQLIDHLKRLDLVVGFNSKRFDYQVLSGYTDFDFNDLSTLDLLELIHQQLGYRLSLDHLARTTLGAGKSGSGLDALRWWQQGNMDKLIAYCRMDVQITRDLYCFAVENGYLIYQHANGQKFRIPFKNLHATEG